jgi:ankyrin repeat protein
MGWTGRRLTGTWTRAAPSCLLVLSLLPLVHADGVRLVDAAKNQDWTAVQALLEDNAAVNERSGDGSTALLWAAHWNDLASVARLVRAGADVNAANDLGMTPLSLACTNASTAVVGALVEAGANVHTPIATGETPLMTCAGTGNADAVRRLLAAGARVDAREPSQGQTALMWAAAESHADVLRVLIEARADLKARTRKGFTALHFAARGGDVETARVLLRAGADVNARSQPDSPEPGRGAAYQASLSAGGTPLLVATMRGHVPMALFLLDQGADPDAGDAGLLPLHWAVGGWEGNVSNPVYGFSDAMSGIQDRQAKLQLVRALLARGANVHARMARKPGFAGGYDDAGVTPFILAAAASDLEMLKILLAAGADPNTLTDTNTNAVMAASGLNRLIGETPITETQALATVKFLIGLGLDGSGASTSGENALFGAAYRGWNVLLALLIAQGAEVNAVTKAGVTPWLAASGYGDRLGGVLYNTEGANLLLKHGADPKLGKPCQAQIKCR